MMKASRKRVLIVAYACEPDKTSEPGVGWHFAHEIAKFMEVTVLTRANNKEVIESKHDTAEIKYLYYDLSGFWTKVKKRVPLGTQIYYTLWQWGAYLKISKILKREEIVYDLIHHLTFGIILNAPPAYLVKKPFVWGPLGGGETIPYNFLFKMKSGAIIRELFYSFSHFLSKISPWAYLIRKKAKAIIFRTTSSAQKFPMDDRDKTYLISETALPEMRVKRIDQRPSNVIRVLCIGRLLPHKGHIYALRGFHGFLESGGKGKLVFLGNGSEESSLKKYVARHALGEYVEFKGFVPNEVVQTELTHSHVLLHPSFREGGSWAILEAMFYGLPVICLNTSGPKDMVTNNCGLLIDLISPAQVSADISNGLICLFKNKKLYAQFSENAISRIKSEYNWDRRREQIKQVYEDVLHK